MCFFEGILLLKEVSDGLLVGIGLTNQSDWAKILQINQHPQCCNSLHWLSLLVELIRRNIRIIDPCIAVIELFEWPIQQILQLHSGHTEHNIIPMPLVMPQLDLQLLRQLCL